MFNYFHIGNSKINTYLYKFCYDMTDISINHWVGNVGIHDHKLVESLTH